MTGTISFIEVILSAKSFKEFIDNIKLFMLLAQSDIEVIDQISQDRKEAEEKKAKLIDEKENQKALVEKLAQKKNDVEKKLKEKNALYAKVKKEIEEIKNAERKKSSYLAKSYRANTQSAYKTSRGSSRSNVVDIALSLLGKPYRWAAAGPNSFDCSGLTMYVYSKVGVSLPHSSRAQYNCGVHISRNNLAPGDLVFFARGSRISHVGIYIGGGNFVHAPQTGDVVKIQSLSSRSNYVGAVRP